MTIRAMPQRSSGSDSRRNESPALVVFMTLVTRVRPPARPACDRPPLPGVGVEPRSDGRRVDRVDLRRRPRPGRVGRGVQRTVATPLGMCIGFRRLGGSPRRLPGIRPLTNGRESRYEFSGPVGVLGVHLPLGPETATFHFQSRSCEYLKKKKRTGRQLKPDGNQPALGKNELECCVIGRWLRGVPCQTSITLRRSFPRRLRSLRRVRSRNRRRYRF